MVPSAFPLALTEATGNFGSWLWRTWELEGRVSLEVCSHLVSIVNFWSVRLQDPAFVFCFVFKVNWGKDHKVNRIGSHTTRPRKARNQAVT